MFGILKSFVVLWVLIQSNAAIAQTNKAHVKINGGNGKYVQCMKVIAKRYRIPMYIFYGIAKTEGGWIGLKRKNTNRTYDLGLMQINTKWLRHFKKHGITERKLRYNGCLNIATAAAIFNYERSNFAKGDSWKAVGHYHSKNKRLQHKYMTTVAKNIERTRRQGLL